MAPKPPYLPNAGFVVSSLPAAKRRFGLGGMREAFTIHKNNAHGPKRTCNPNHTKQMRTNAIAKQHAKKKPGITHISLLHCIAAKKSNQRFLNCATHTYENL